MPGRPSGPEPGGRRPDEPRGGVHEPLVVGHVEAGGELEARLQPLPEGGRVDVVGLGEGRRVRMHVGGGGGRWWGWKEWLFEGGRRWWWGVLIR